MKWNHVFSSSEKCTYTCYCCYGESFLHPVFNYYFTSSIFYTHSSNFRHAVWSLRSSSAPRPCTHPLLISWSVNQGEKLGWKTNQPPGRKIPAKHLWVTALFLSLSSPSPHVLSLSILSPFPHASPLLHVRDLFLWSPACDTRPWAHWAVSVPRGSCTVKLSQGCLASYRPSTRSRSTMLIWGNLIHYVMLSLIIYPPLSFH